ncbi:hypothetical protein ACFLS1_03125 [Verrucomicrobiota bacterium]
MSADSYDNDLLGASRGHGEGIEETNGVPVRSISEDSLNKMAKQREALSNQVVGATEEIERLRMKQNELEKEKTALESFAKKQEEYEKGKLEMREKLERSMVLVEKEQIQAVRMNELLSETRALFNDTLSELENINEDKWTDDNFEAELNRGLALIDSARMDYRKALAKIDASSWHKSSVKKEVNRMVDEADEALSAEKSFGYWLKVGFAVTMPLILALLVFLLIYLVVTSRIFI